MGQKLILVAYGARSYLPPSVATSIRVSVQMVIISPSSNPGIGSPSAILQ
jgi:hypothetical protein